MKIIDIFGKLQNLLKDKKDLTLKPTTQNDILLIMLLFLFFAKTTKEQKGLQGFITQSSKFFIEKKP